jgi:hypothetical protein
MRKKLWIDDLRDPPDDSWEVVRTAHRALCLLEDNEYEEVSFDNDLGYGSLYGNKMLEGRNILGWLRNRQANGLYVPPVLRVHTSNPDAALAMESDVSLIIGDVLKSAGMVVDRTHRRGDAETLDKFFGREGWDDKPRD